MTFIVAELGTNWDGDLHKLKELVKDCAFAGVDAVKLQALSQDLLARHPELKYYKDSSVNKSNIGEIDQICRDYGVPWHCTITDISQIDLLKTYLNTAKIRAADCEKLDLVQATVDAFKSVIISSPRPLYYKGNIVNLYGIPKYPTEFGEINFDMIQLMNGYSNHCMNPLAIFRAVRLGAQMVEIHVTPSRDEFHLDNKVSYTVNEIKEIIAWTRL